MWQRIWRDWDWTIVICTVLLVATGIIAIGSATHVNQDGLQLSDLVTRQTIFFLVNAIIVIAIQWIDYHKLRDWSNAIYVLTIVMLLAVMVVGTSALGAQRWIQIGPITIQPSEFSKLLMFS